MSQSAADEFVTRVTEDPILAQELAEARVRATIEFASGRGFEFTAEELAAADVAIKDSDYGPLPDSLLDLVSGGGTGETITGPL